MDEDGQARLEAMANEWDQAVRRRNLAQQTFLGAQSDVLAKEARFKGALEFAYGPGVTFDYNEEKGLHNIVVPELAQSARAHRAASGGASGRTDSRSRRHRAVVT